jgi:hypothetical protein
MGIKTTLAEDRIRAAVEEEFKSMSAADALDIANAMADYLWRRADEFRRRKRAGIQNPATGYWTDYGKQGHG